MSLLDPGAPGGVALILPSHNKIDDTHKSQMRRCVVSFLFFFTQDSVDLPIQDLGHVKPHDTCEALSLTCTRRPTTDAGALFIVSYLD